MIRAKIAKQMAENPEFAWGLEDSVISGGTNQETASPNDSPSGYVFLEGSCTAADDTICCGGGLFFVLASVFPPTPRL